MDPFVGEIRAVGFNFAPKGWALCNGQLLPIAQNTALFSLLGTFYGGDGKSTFALPDLQGRVVVDAGQGPGLSQRFIGEQGGEASHTLQATEMPAHRHGVGANTGAGTAASAAAATFAVPAVPLKSAAHYTAGGVDASLSANAVTFAGGNQPHENRQPYLVVNYIIALQGIFPARS